jgi:REP element-mobilizing transposase RayT
VPKEHPTRKRHRLDPEAYTDTRCACFFTICARHHKDPFRNDTLARAVVDSLLWTRAKYQWALYSYCLMPDHLHFVCRPTEQASRVVNAGARGRVLEGVLDQVARFKSFTTRKGWECGLSGELWQRSSYDEVLDDLGQIESAARYSLDNPVRKQLVMVWTEWPYSGLVDPW